jgi:hypothetical protein
MSSADGAALIVLSMICSNIRSCRLPSSRLKALDLFLALCPHLTDESKLDRMLPYLVDLLHDESADVRAAALRTLIQLVSRLQSNVYLTHSWMTDPPCHCHYAIQRSHIPGIYYSECGSSDTRP